MMSWGVLSFYINYTIENIVVLYSNLVDDYCDYFSLESLNTAMIQLDFSWHGIVSWVLMDT